MCAAGDVAQQRLHRLLAFDFAGVNVGLDVDPQSPRGAHVAGGGSVVRPIIASGSGRPSKE